MNAVYTDIHIHTSDNPNQLNFDYDVDLLVQNIKRQSASKPTLVSLTDHNAINKNAYIRLARHENVHPILGVELHIRKFENAKPYHCHLLINTPINEDVIDDINKILDCLYPDKVVTDSMENIPSIEDIANSFDIYDYLLLPHGGQSHRTFDKSLQEGRNFDTTLERSLYYNHFDGFTSRSTTGVDQTLTYFRRLGIHEFTNLITCSDNYNPANYPNAKSSEAEPFIPTWINSSPSFDGLRISLSETSRLHYGHTPPDSWSEFIGQVRLENDKADIDVLLTPGLNVVIGGSSSGKTLFVDSLFKKITSSCANSKYTDFSIDNMYVENRSGITPHYINQNFIISVLQSEDKGINDIELISKVFPEDGDTISRIQKSLQDLKLLLDKLLSSVKRIEQCQHELSSISKPSHLIVSGIVAKKLIDHIHPDEVEYHNIFVSQTTYESYKENLESLQEFVKQHPLGGNLDREFSSITTELNRLFGISNLSEKIYDTMSDYRKSEERTQQQENRETHAKLSMRQTLINVVYTYLSELNTFYSTLNKLKLFNVRYSTKEVLVQGHTLKIENSYELTNAMMTDAFNKFLKRDFRVESLDEINPECLFSSHFSESPRVRDYEDFALKVFSKINDNNKKKYVLITKDGDDFDSLSPGWKSAIILDLVLGYDLDFAPIIIDQPEDNLATGYMNHDFIKRIKEVKKIKQVILVSHNATIPILGDAQNVIVCNNMDGKIKIRSAPLEGKMENKSILDQIAELTDGGKPSIKKRVKKYNLKSYREA